MRLSIPILRTLCDPTEISPWGLDAPVSHDLITKCLADRLFVFGPILHEEWEDPIIHAQRIAFFCEYGWTDEIEVDVGIPDMGCTVRWPVTDGNHRFSAAIYLGRPWIEASLGGSLDYAEDINLIAYSALDRLARARREIRDRQIKKS